MADVKIRVWVMTDKVGSKCEKVVTWDADDWNAMTDHDRDEVMRDELDGMFEWGWSEAN